MERIIEALDKRFPRPDPEPAVTASRSGPTAAARKRG
jgi:hypothetical protein